MDKILIFGTGTSSEYIFSKLDQTKVSILGFVTSNSSNNNFHGYTVYSLSSISSIAYDYILIASGYVEPILAQLKSENIPNHKIVSYIFDNAQTYQNMANCLNTYLSTKFNRELLESWTVSDYSVPKIYPAVFWDESNTIDSIYKDFVREQTLFLLSRQIIEKNIPGSIAELGVYKGDFSIILERCFPDRTIHLFDTFEGFNSSDIVKDSTINNISGESSKFKDTSVELVLSRMKQPQNIVIHKGFFPDSYTGDIDNLSFVSIDLNLFDPVKAALDIMYPLLSKGGYILISDYYSPYYQGSKEAVDIWCRENQKTLIPVADFYGSAIIVK